VFRANQLDVHKLSQASVMFVALTQQQERAKPTFSELFSQGQFCPD
jgi:hypothetical protein